MAHRPLPQPKRQPRQVYPVTTRQMTEEEWITYGPAIPRRGGDVTALNRFPTKAERERYDEGKRQADSEKAGH